jgi:hypothetical protein
MKKNMFLFFVLLQLLNIDLNALSIDNKLIENAINNVKEQKYGFDCQWVSLRYLEQLIPGVKLDENKPVSLSIDVSSINVDMINKFFGDLARIKYEKDNKYFIKVGAIPKLVTDYINKQNTIITATLHESQNFNQETFIENIILSLSNGLPVFVYTQGSDGFTTHGSLIIGYEQDDNNNDIFTMLETVKHGNSRIVKKNNLFNSMNASEAIAKIKSLHNQNYDIVHSLFSGQKGFFFD